MVLSVEEYKAMSRLENFPSDDAIEKAIKEAEEDVNIMTYGRIYASRVQYAQRISTGKDQIGGCPAGRF